MRHTTPDNDLGEHDVIVGYRTQSQIRYCMPCSATLTPAEAMVTVDEERIARERPSHPTH